MGTFKKLFSNLKFFTKKLILYNFLIQKIVRKLSKLKLFSKICFSITLEMFILANFKGLKNGLMQINKYQLDQFHTLQVKLITFQREIDIFKKAKIEIATTREFN